MRKVSGVSRRMSERKGGQAGEHWQQLKVTSNRQLVVRGERKHTRPKATQHEEDECGGETAHEQSVKEGSAEMRGRGKY